MCHQANEEPAWQCRRCGYEFGQSIDKLRGMLLEQLGRARITFWILFAICGAVLAGVVYAIVHGHAIVPGFTLVMVVWWTVRARQTISLSKYSLASIERQQAQLPKATVVAK
jgi:hypothetical protein